MPSTFQGFIYYHADGLFIVHNWILVLAPTKYVEVSPKYLKFLIETSTKQFRVLFVVFPVPGFRVEFSILQKQNFEHFR